jgi:hypothetical protein
VEETIKKFSMALIGAARYKNRDYGGVNGVLWFMRENELIEDGVASYLRTAVLLRRSSVNVNRRFLAHVRIKAEIAGRSFLSSLMSRSLECKADTPVLFNPVLEAKNSDIKGNDLGSEDLMRFAMIATLGPSSGDGTIESAPMAVEDKSWSEGSTKDQILLNFSRGQYAQLSYKFKRFETLALLNLYNYQHKLVELDKKANGGKMDEQDANELARLFREYCK